MRIKFNIRLMIFGDVRSIINYVKSIILINQYIKILMKRKIKLMRKLKLKIKVKLTRKLNLTRKVKLKREINRCRWFHGKMLITTGKFRGQMSRGQYYWSLGRLNKSIHG